MPGDLHSILRRLLSPIVMLATLLATFVAEATPPTLVAQTGVTAPASISELARALKYDANLIYEYVYTNIEYSPTDGVKKGALGTLLDGAGNDMDQATLMAALLQQSGYTVSYVYGYIRLTPTQTASWLGTDPTNWCVASALLIEGGIPITFYSVPPDCSTQPDYFLIVHTWLSVTGGSFGSSTYVYDPSYKQYATTSGINLASAMGYSQSTFMTSAKVGSTTDTNSIQNLNTGNIQSSLLGYTNNLVNYIRTNIPTATMNDVAGGRYIQPIAQPYTPQTSLPYEAPGDVPLVWPDSIPSPYHTTLEVKIGGIDQTFYSDQIYGHRLSIVYNASNQPVLYVDGVSLATGTANANTISYTVTYPFCYATTGPSNPGCPISTGYTNIYSFQSIIQPGNGYTYAIVNGWDFTGRGIVEFHRRQLQANKAAGNSDSSEAVLGEALNMVGYAWLAQLSATAGLNDRLIGSKFVVQSAVGIVGQAYGPYIDIPGLFVGTSTLTPDANRAITAFFSNFSAGSAFEWGTLDQNFLNSNIGSVSTVKLMDIANTTGNVFYQATSANWTAVQSVLSNYSASDIANISTNYISKGFSVIVPQHGNLTQNAWSGAGYIASNISGGLGVIGYLISHNLKGAFPDADLPPAQVSPPVELTGDPVIPPPAKLGKDPIDLSSGAYRYDHDDLSVGSGAYPFNLGFRRSYNSNNSTATGPLGPGWTHNFSITALINSDGLKGLGQDSPLDGAAAIAASYVIQDLFSDTAKPLDKTVVTSLAQKWLMDRMINNTVNVTIGVQTEQFMLLADGSYNPRLGSSSRLSLSGGIYTFQYKDGTTLNFNANGNIASWTSPSGTSVSYSYDMSTPPLLTSVSNGLGRTLTLNYNGSKQLTSVNDNSSPQRSVSYSFDTPGNLASFTDPIGNTTTYAYLPGAGSSPSGLLTQIFYPSHPSVAAVTNTYDSLNRIQTQANAFGTNWAYYFAGYRSEEDDPYGTQHVLYYNPRGLTLFDIQDYAGLDLQTATLYDGLDRPGTVTLPEGGSTAYTYATTNPWANNVASVTRTPKPGSLLSPLTMSYTYDPTFNKPTSITDPLGLVTTMGYDSSTGNLLSATADAGTGAHFNATTRFTYTGFGQVGSKTDPMGTITQYAYDSFGNRTSTIADAGSGHLNQTTSYAYNSTGDVTSVTDPRGNVATSTYDADRRLATTTTPPVAAALGGVVTTNSYDPDGRVLQVQQSAGGSVLRTTSATYTLTGKPATATDPNANVTRYAYDLLDRLTSTTDAAGRVTTNVYDALSRRLSVSNPAISSTPLAQQSFTPDGLLASLTDANSNTTSFAYDGFDRPVTTAYPGGTTETYRYDVDGNILTRKTRAGGTITFTYDTLNRLSTKSPPSSPVVTYTYDLASRQTGVSDTSASIAAVATPGSTTAYVTNYTYDALNRPLNAGWNPAPTAATPSAITPVTFGHTYNAVNQRIGQSVSDNTWIGYPSGAGATAYTANSLNQYTAVGTVTPTYDANGNLTYDGTYTLGYDAENRLTSASGAGNTASYAFDGRGRRKLKTVNSTTTITITDTDNRAVLDYDGSSGTILRWYAYGLGPNALLNQMNMGAGTRATLIPDMLGSIIGSMDSSTAAISSFAYRPYGSSSAPPVQFGYTGQRIDAESGFYYYRTRQYHSGWGRFLQSDPVGYSAGVHLYAYVGNDPLNLVDPSGLLSVGGVINFTLGAGEVAIGVGFGTVTSWTGVGAVAGGAVALHGADVAQAAWRGTDTFTSQGLQAAGLSQNTANAISTGITGAAYIAAGAQIIPYGSAAISGGTGGTSLLAMTARGFQLGNESSNAVLDALQSYYGTGTNAAAIGRAASAASSVLGYGLEGGAAIQGGVIGQAQGAEAGTSQGAGK